MSQRKVPSENKSLEEIQVELQQVRNELGRVIMDVKAFHVGNDLPEVAAKRLAFFEDRLEKVEYRLRTCLEQVNSIATDLLNHQKQLSILEHRMDKREANAINKPLSVFDDRKLWEVIHKHEALLIELVKKYSDTQVAVQEAQIVDHYDSSGHMYRYAPKQEGK